jgi:hypothetical protein
MKTANPKASLRRAVYTRVSTEHGLEQEFDSLDNQREVSEAYIKSQAHEGCKLLQRDQGVRLDELIAATGWLPHTARAALTGLRHRSYDVRVEREKGRASIYRALSTLALAS